MATKLKHNRVTPNVKAACEDCRRRKTKCDGARPVCSQCAKRSRNCEWDAEPDEYRTTTLKRKCNMFERQALEAQQLLFTLRDSPEIEATEVLRRLRAGEDVPTIVNSILCPQAPRDEQRIRSPSFAESHFSTSGANTLPQPPQAHNQLQQQDSPQPQPFKILDRSRLAIDFLVNGSDEAGTSTMHQSSIEAARLVATNSPHLLRVSSYPPITTASLEQPRRLSAPLSSRSAPELDVLAMEATARSAAVSAATVQEAIRVVQGSFSDWADYHANVSSLFRSLGEPQRGPLP